MKSHDREIMDAYLHVTGESVGIFYRSNYFLVKFIKENDIEKVIAQLPQKTSPPRIGTKFSNGASDAQHGFLASIGKA